MYAVGHRVARARTEVTRAGRNRAYAHDHHVPIAGRLVEVDALWPDERLVAELQRIRALRARHCAA
jgi:hypothetical protein